MMMMMLATVGGPLLLSRIYWLDIESATCQVSS